MQRYLVSAKVRTCCRDICNWTETCTGQLSDQSKEYFTWFWKELRIAPSAVTESMDTWVTSAASSACSVHCKTNRIKSLNPITLKDASEWLNSLVRIRQNAPHMSMCDLTKKKHHATVKLVRTCVSSSSLKCSLSSLPMHPTRLKCPPIRKMSVSI